MSEVTKQSPVIRTLLFAWRWTKRLAMLLVGLLLLYFAIVLIGLIPVNNDFQPADEGVEIHLTSNAVHADLILPLVSEQVDWREAFPAADFAGDCSAATHVAIGWGDKGFFINTPTWADLRASTAAKALLWRSDACVHVVMTRAEYLGDDGHSIRISPKQYAALVNFIQATLKSDPSGTAQRIPETAYHQNDAFYEAHGAYHCLNTCNSWVGRALRAAGVRTPWLTPLPKSVFLYLPE